MREERKLLMFPRQEVIYLPSTQINDFYQKETVNIVLVARLASWPSHFGTRPPLVTVVQAKASTSGWRLQQVRPHITSLQNHQFKVTVTEKITDSVTENH